MNNNLIDDLTDEQKKQMLVSLVKDQLSKPIYYSKEKMANVLENLRNKVAIISEKSRLGKALGKGIQAFKEKIKANTIEPAVVEIVEPIITTNSVISTPSYLDDKTVEPKMEVKTIIPTPEYLINDTPIVEETIEKPIVEPINDEPKVEVRTIIPTPAHMDNEKFTMETLTQEADAAMKPVTATITDITIPGEHPAKIKEAIEEIKATKATGEISTTANLVSGAVIPNQINIKSIGTLPKMVMGNLGKLLSTAFNKSNNSEEKVENLTEDQINDGINKYLEKLNAKAVENVSIIKPKEDTFPVIDRRVNPETFYEVKAALDARKAANAEQQSIEQPKIL